MKIRTVYFKISDMEKAVHFWTGLTSKPPQKASKYWSEFKCENINLGLLWMEDFKVAQDASNFVPVFELKAEVLESYKEKAMSLGASIVVDISEHPDKMSYVLADPFGNEFELTKFHD